ncbi:J domain-containing protein [Emcibacteraceae bacterium]|nr:J domain-containing protein [Emcibacteraceae bacterium]
MNKGPFFGAASPSWTQKQNSSTENNEGYHKPYAEIKSDVRMKHIGSENTLNYTKEDLEHLKTLGLDTGANKEEIKKAYKTLVKHCHPDQNPDLEHGNYIFTKITEAYNALKNKDFK